MCESHAIEVSRYALIPLEETTSQLYHQGVESEEPYVCQMRCFLGNKREIPLPLYARLWPTTHGIGNEDQ